MRYTSTSSRQTAPNSIMTDHTTAKPPSGNIPTRTMRSCHSRLVRRFRCNSRSLRASNASAECDPGVPRACDTVDPGALWEDDGKTIASGDEMWKTLIK